MSVRQKSPSPGGLRSSRNRALEIGTTPAGFPPELPYESGVPASIPGASSDWQSNNPPGIPDPGPPVAVPSPFKLGQK